MASAVSNIHANNGNARFNDEALSWDSRPFVHEASKSACEAITRKLSTDQSAPTSSSRSGLQVLEIGCGTGILSFLMAKDPSIARVVAVDAAEGMIDVLKTKLSKDSEASEKIVPLALMLEDPDDPALPKGEDGKALKFDLITSHLVLHHIPDLESVLRTMHGCLAPGGLVMLTDFEDFGTEAKRFHPASKMDGVARHGINAKEMEEMLTGVGFQDVEVKAQWTMEKIVEKSEGEFGREQKAGEGMGEVMEFPFVLCYGVKK